MVIFKVIDKEYGGVFKIKTIDLYNKYKSRYSNTIVIIKEGLFYKTLGEDAKLIWHLFNYKYVKDTVSFGMAPYNNVIMKLNDLDIFSLVVISLVLILLSKCSFINFNFSSFDQYLFFPPFGLPIKSSP